MNSSLQSKIEKFLLSRGDWVPSLIICAIFGVTERQLRQVADTPGLCTLIAISGDKGYKHYRLATDAEWDHYAARETKIHTSALENVRHKEALRLGITKEIKTENITIEKQSGQMMMKDMLPTPRIS